MKASQQREKVALQKHKIDLLLSKAYQVHQEKEENSSYEY